MRITLGPERHGGNYTINYSLLFTPPLIITIHLNSMHRHGTSVNMKSIGTSLTNISLN